MRSHPHARTRQSSRTIRPRQRVPTVHETSAGGVVIRRIKGHWHVALLKIRHARGEVWVLPKGHVEHHRGETRDVAAVREVREELGIANVRVLRKLGVVRWQFMGTLDRRAKSVKPGTYARRPLDTARGEPLDVARGNSVRVVKTVHHYLMEGLSEHLKPQASEGFLEARWVPYARALKLLAYPTDSSIVAKVLEKKK